MGLFSSGDDITNTTETTVNVDASPIIEIDIDRLADSADGLSSTASQIASNLGQSFSEGLKSVAATTGFIGFVGLITWMILRR